MKDKGNRKTRDSVFTSLFRDKNNLLKLYKTLHPEDDAATEESLRNITLSNTFINDIYNDLGFIVENRLIVLAESQSTWTYNILWRTLFYANRYYSDYLKETKQNLYLYKKAAFPNIEIYIIYTGERGNKPEEISLIKDFFNGRYNAIEVKAKVICEKESDDIINQYIRFCKIYTEQLSLLGNIKKAVAETIKICINQNILKEYLNEKKKEVITMFDMFDENYLRETYYDAMIKDAKEEGIALGRNEGIALGRDDNIKETAIRMIKSGKCTDEFISEISGLSIEDINKLKEKIYN